jgi:exodeoxyribonuclease V alpha subunit
MAQMIAHPVTRNAPVQIELTAKFLKDRFRFPNIDMPDNIIADVIGPKGRTAIKGPCELGELREGQSYVFFGHWVKYKNKKTGLNEDQFAFTTFVREAPANREAVISYLSQHGEGNGIGKVRCVKLWETLGPDAVRIAREEPARVVDTLAAVGLRVTIEQAEELSQRLQIDVNTEKTKLDLCGLLDGRGFPKTLASTAIQTWGNLASQMIRRNPYRLMQFKHCGFKKCDSMYLDLGLPAAAMKRQALSAWYSIARDTEGSTWYPRSYPDAFIRSNISGANVNVDAALKLATRAKILAEVRSDGFAITNDGKLWYAEHKKAHHETEIAQGIVFSRKEKNLWPDVNSISNITEHQRAELAKAMATPIGILGGSPGTGKTWSVASLVDAIGRQYGFNNIAIGTPTGKAGVRVTENLAERKIELRARTWYSSLLQLDSLGLKHFPKKFLIGDETSMNDTDIMASIFRARANGTHILFVGDVNQLAPVGHGAPFRDLIAAGIAYGELREIKRNSGGIVEACAAIRDGLRWQPGDNLILDTQVNPESQIAACIRHLNEARRLGMDPVWDCQPVVAVNEKSPLSRKDMNKLLQQHLNHQPGIEGLPFRLDDKLVNTANGFFKVAGRIDDDSDRNDRGEVYVANGELAKVLHIERGMFIAELQSPNRVIEIRMNGQKATSSDVATTPDESASTGCTFELGYALSVHKSQGSDWPWVLPILDEYPGARMVCDRSWFYTAISRAKDRCILIGKRDTADRMIRISNIAKRKTFLKERILHLSAVEQLADL